MSEQINIPETTKYTARGLVYGRYWGGGEGSYSAKVYTGETAEEINQKITKAVEDGSIDAGMGYEKVLGAMMVVTCFSSVTVNGKVYTNEEPGDPEFYGDLDEEQQDFLLANFEY